MFCKDCGRKIGDNNYCPHCGAKNNVEAQEPIKEEEFQNNITSNLENINEDAKSNNQSSQQQDYNYQQYNQTQQYYAPKKSRLTAALLQIFVGAFGIGRFYLGYTNIGILQIVASVVSCGIGGAIWGLIDGIMILNGTILTDANGNTLDN